MAGRCSALCSLFLLAHCAEGQYPSWLPFDGTRSLFCLRVLNICQSRSVCKNVQLARLSSGVQASLSDVDGGSVQLVSALADSLSFMAFE